MSLDAAYILPHPPLAVPEVGRGDEADIKATIDGYHEVARRIAAIAPDDIIIISPHTAYYADWVYMAGGESAEGDMAQFRAPQVKLTLKYDVDLRERIEGLAREKGIPAGVIGTTGGALDHGIMVPMYFVNQEYPASRFCTVSIGGSALPREQLLKFGSCIAKAACSVDRKCVLLVSGDLSHKLKADGPYGLDPAGPVFDDAFVSVIEGGDPLAFAELDADMCEAAAECGLSGFIMMAGALDEAEELEDVRFTSELISHEGPFGVGYGIAAFEKRPAHKGAHAASASTDPLVALARDTISQYVTEQTVPEPRDLGPGEPERAGCFVSIHTASTGELRGCIGTIEPTQDTLAEEIIENAVSASTRDPRFLPIQPEELDDLSINVDVLFKPEPATLADMDVKRYGIIITMGWHRGLLLPDLDGVDTVEEQYRIACMKAGISPNTDPNSVQIERFEVVRHV